MQASLPPSLSFDIPQLVRPRIEKKKENVGERGY